MLFGALLFASRARADGMEGISLFPKSGNIRGGAELEAASFRNQGQGRRGSYESAITRLEYAPTDDLGLRLRIPFDTLALEGREGTTQGFGDTELRIRLQLKQADPLKISAGWVTQLPTGSPHAGLGEGAVQLTPFVSAGYKRDRTVIYLTVADTVSLAGTHRVRTTNYVDPSEDHELTTTVGTIYRFTDLVSGSVILSEITVLTKEDLGQSLMIGAVQLGAQPDRRLRLVLAQQLPLFGEHRFSWKLNAAATYAF